VSSSLSKCVLGIFAIGNISSNLDIGITFGTDLVTTTIATRVDSIDLDR